MMEESSQVMLSAHEARVLGCLMEKQMTTPDYYPLTLKALCAACNQKSSRLPVMNVSDSEVMGTVNALRSQGLVTARVDGRVDRYEQHLSRKLAITVEHRAVLCVLMLRGPLTLNQIQINTARMVQFDHSDQVQILLDELIDQEKALLIKIPRAAGQREDRYAHLLCGEVLIENSTPPSVVKGSDHPTTVDRIDQLEQEVMLLKQEIQQLKESMKSHLQKS